jgi:diguanylate cyclase (GGDEF)-like protein/PAS domain S-box-containing protein
MDDATPLRPGPDELMDDRYLLDTFMEHTPDHVYFKDAQSRFLRISQALASWLDLASPTDAIGLTDFDFFDEEHARNAFADEQHLMRTGEPLVGIEEKESRGGRESWVSTTKVPLRDRNGRIIGVFGISRDITERKQDELRLAEQTRQLEEQAEELSRMTLSDELTGLHNRRGLEAFGEQALYRARRAGTPVALLFLDLDGLKRINDSFGHGVGDNALRAVAAAITGSIRESDIASRIGGDEFCLLLFDEAGETVDQVVKRIRTAAAGARLEHGLPFELSVSIGVIRIDARTPGSIEQLLGEADKSMYTEKLGKLGQLDVRPDVPRAATG